MIVRISHVTILVRDQDEALAWYTGKLGFEKRADTVFGSGLRWLTVAPKGQPHPQIVLQKPMPELHRERAKEMDALVGEGTMWALETEDCRKAFAELSSRGVRFTSPPEEMPWGITAVFTDLYGNPFMLLEPRAYA